ncbi:MAG: radical SAM protein [Clostridia bacterium]|nr:radical SAM protein [Clostridia bacterium]
MRIFQKGFNFGQDGPGNRLVYHLQGCNMRCIWCSNPEGMSFGGGTEYSPEEIEKECIRSKMMFFSGGGVTFTGGEATAQADDLLEVLRKLRNADIHTCIETNGTSTRLAELLEYIDYLIMDFKHYDSDTLKKYTGVGNEQIKKNFEMLCQSGRQAHIRIPLINGVNTGSPQGFAEYFSRYDTGNVVFEFLCYHEYGKDKWTEEYKMENGFVSKEKLQEFIAVFKEYGLKIVTT